jgi:dipeptidyl aminopeptidase/acylaminoacyl peptidase
LINTNYVADPKQLIRVGALYQYDLVKKAEKNNLYLVKRETAEQPPKYYYTSDFVTFKQVTSDSEDNRPFGIITEVVSWNTPNGASLQGVLYKPMNFDSSKRYPIIFVYYDAYHNQPHNVYTPYGLGDLTDYGYLVFSADINYEIGESGKSVLNAVVSAAKLLSKRKYVDSKRMGLRGGSFGGYETNYIITHSNIFAAAISGAGYSDFISNIGSLDKGIRPHSLEGGNGQQRLGVTMWERPDIWIKNSPLFYADRVSTPLLIVHSMSDVNVPFEQNVAFFKALRYFGKKVWMLQYDNSGHIGGAFSKSIVGKDDGNCDMCTRQLQFFNHYLKGQPAPLWMLDGIPAREKGKKTGLELDTLGRTPGPGLRREKLILTSQQE